MLGCRFNSVFKFNNIQKGQRKKLHELDLVYSGETYGEFVDHKQMKTYEFAEFQKKLYLESRQRRRRFRIVFGIALGIFIITVIYFLFFYNAGPVQPLDWKLEHV